MTGVTALREALPTQWMKDAYDRWRVKQKSGERDEDRLAGWVIETLKQQREDAVSNKEAV